MQYTEKEMDEVMVAYRAAEDELFTALNDRAEANPDEEPMEQFLDNLPLFDKLIEAGNKVWEVVMTDEEREKKQCFLEVSAKEAHIFPTPTVHVNQIFKDLEMANMGLLPPRMLLAFETSMWPILREELGKVLAERVEANGGQ